MLCFPLQGYHTCNISNILIYVGEHTNGSYNLVTLRCKHLEVLCREALRTSSPIRHPIMPTTTPFSSLCTVGLWENSVWSSMSYFSSMLRNQIVYELDRYEIGYKMCIGAARMNGICKHEVFSCMFSNSSQISRFLGFSCLPEFNSPWVGTSKLNSEGKLNQTDESSYEGMSVWA